MKFTEQDYLDHPNDTAMPNKYFREAEYLREGWQPIETAPRDGEWLIGRLSGRASPPAFVGKVYDHPRFRGDPSRLHLIDERTGKWMAVDAWMPLPAPPRGGR